MIRKFFVFVLLCLPICIAQADPIPTHLKEFLKLNSMRANAVILDKGVLKITLKRPIVRYELYEGVINSRVCLSLDSRGKNAWGKAKIDRIEVLNDIEKQGFAMIGGRKTCNEMSKFTGMQDKERAAYLYANTWVCVVGNCRERRPNEKIAGEE